MQALILAGGKGTRFMEETVVKPKPMIEICNKPILFHIIDHYSFFGVDEFIILAGYKIEYIIDYFNKQNLKYKHGAYVTDKNLKIKVLDTGNETMTGGRIKRASEFINEKFFLTYGDGLANVNVQQLAKFHLSHNKIGTITVTNPVSRFGLIEFDNDQVVNNFVEKPKLPGFVNIGFMAFKKEIINFLDDNVILESSPLQNLSKKSQLLANIHDGYFEPMDTYREYLQMNEYWKSGQPPWLDI